MARKEIYEAEQLLFELKNSIAPKEPIQRLQEIFSPIFEREREKEVRQQLEIDKWSWGDFIPHKNLSAAVNTLSNVIGFHQEAKLEEDKYNDATQDLLHAFELTDPTDEELIDLGKQLMTLRKQRRKTKNFIELTEPLFHFAMKNRNLVKELGQIRTEMEKNMHTLETRSYYVREQTSLQDAFEKANAKKLVTA